MRKLRPTKIMPSKTDFFVFLVDFGVILGTENGPKSRRNGPKSKLEKTIEKRGLRRLWEQGSAVSGRLPGR